MWCHSELISINRIGETKVHRSTAIHNIIILVVGTKYERIVADTISHSLVDMGQK